MTEENLVRAIDNLMLFIKNEIPSGKITFVAKVHLINSLRDTLNFVKNKSDKG